MEIKKSHQWEKTHRHALTIEEQSAFLNYIASNEQYKHWLPMFTLFLGTGCRVGEIVGLRWEDCDFKQRIININHTLIYRLQDDGRVEYHITTPKTEAGIREIPMMDEVYDALVQLKNWQVLVGDRGPPKRPSTVLQTGICYSPMESPLSSLRPQIATIPLFL